MCVEPCLKSQNRVSETNSSLLSLQFLRGKGNLKEINFDSRTQNVMEGSCFHDPARFLPPAQLPLLPSLGLQRPFKPSSSPGEFIQGGLAARSREKAGWRGGWRDPARSHP